MHCMYVYVYICIGGVCVYVYMYVCVYIYKCMYVNIKLSDVLLTLQQMFNLI